MNFNRDYVKDLKTCIKRFYRCGKLIKNWMNYGGGNMDIFTFLNLEGDSTLDLPRHPYLDYNEEEKAAFRAIFGEPLVVPKNLNRSVTIKQFLATARKRRDLMRECAGMTEHSRFRGVESTSPERRRGVERKRRRRVKAL